MDGRSTTALTTLCSAIEQRAISSAHEVQSLVAALESTPCDIPQLSLLASALEELNQRASQLDASLISSTVSMELHDTFKQLLTRCDASVTVLYKQLLRLRPDNAGSINTEFLAAHWQAVNANGELLNWIKSIVAT
ncbi:ankyrin repeat [Trichoderma cornu-damae]|uniref:Ankyrin repeat n=1 Tax=Trichoderma cornu-damae TaxID=654480 RepID=A0A9P8QNR0_9HYPO|nr:ankyrin repeat [Trichoderma cornu-damae]